MKLMMLILKSFQKETTDFILKKRTFCSLIFQETLPNVYLPLHRALWPTVFFLVDRSGHF